VFSLAHRRKITEQGVTFASPVDGSKVFLGPEESMRIQRALDSDIVMIFDECTPYEVNGVVTGEKRARESMELSLRWAERSQARARGQRRGAVRHRARSGSTRSCARVRQRA
jgi:queuine tRNA-ribosyltransferase